MHSFPAVAQLAQLQFCGEVIETISIGFQVVHFNLSGGGYIACTVGFEQVTADGEVRQFDVEERQGQPLWTDLLLKPVAQLIREDDTHLTLQLSDGSKLTILSDLGPYESGKLSWGGGSFWVF